MEVSIYDLVVGDVIPLNIGNQVSDFFFPFNLVFVRNSMCLIESENYL